MIAYAFQVVVLSTFIKFPVHLVGDYLFKFKDYLFLFSERELTCTSGEGQRERGRENPNQSPCCQCEA